METGDSQYIYQNELDKDYFHHDMVYGDFKDLTWRTTLDKGSEFYKRWMKYGYKIML